MLVQCCFQHTHAISGSFFVFTNNFQMKKLHPIAHIHLKLAHKKYPQIVHRGTRNIVILNSTDYQNIKLYNGKALKPLTMSISFSLLF